MTSTDYPVNETNAIALQGLGIELRWIAADQTGTAHESFNPNAVTPDASPQSNKLLSLNPHNSTLARRFTASSMPKKLQTHSRGPD